MNVKFFASASAFRNWLEKNHAKENVLQVGYYKKNSGKPSITYKESVDEALCFGWIDGVKGAIDEISYTIRFTPRRARSIWSTYNTNRVKELTKQGRMHQSGLDAFAKRDEKRSGIYSAENKDVMFDSTSEKKLKANKKAWEFFQQTAPSYKRTCTWTIMSAKKEETKERRLQALIEHSAQGKTLPQFTRKKKK